MTGSVSVQVCKSWVENSGVVTCSQLEWIQAYMLPPEAEGYLTLLMGGFDATAFKQGFGGAMGLFAIGLSVGVILAALRKAR